MQWVPSRRTAGVDISDSSITWVVLGDPQRGSRRVESWGEETLPEGVVSAGEIHDEAGLIQALRALRSTMPRVARVHAPLPEEPAFVFGMSVPAGASKQDILNMIEFDGRVPIPSSSAVYDFETIPHQVGEAQEIGVSVFPRELVDGYKRCFSAAGFPLPVFEIASRAIARAAVSQKERDAVTLLVDLGAERSRVVLLKRGVPIFSSTVGIGVGSSFELETFSDMGNALGSEVARHFTYWDTKRNERGERVAPVSSVLLVGNGAHVKGLGDHIASRVQAAVIHPNVWGNVCSFDEYIPPIDHQNSFRYATAIGLALR
jgi:Tfp pilus assembly PilM family ATPase